MSVIMLVEALIGAIGIPDIITIDRSGVENVNVVHKRKSEAFLPRLVNVGPPRPGRLGSTAAADRQAPSRLGSGCYNLPRYGLRVMRCSIIFCFSTF